MLIAVVSQDFRTVTAHAGKSRRFLVFKVAPCRAPLEVDRLDLPKDQSILEFKGEGAHPLDVADVVIAGSAGAGFIARMEARGIRTVTTTETDPVIAIARLLAGTLVSSAPRGPIEADRCDCHRA